MPTPPIDPDDLFALLWQQSAEHAFVLMDVDGVILRWGGAAEQVLGYSEQEAIGQPIAMIFTPEDARKGMPELERIIAGTDGRSEDDRWHVRKDGTRIWVTGALMPLRIDAVLVGFAKILRDRTDLRIEIEQARNRLVAMESTLASCDTSFARIAHELRNVLGPMKNATELLARDDSATGTRFPVALLRRQMDVMQRLLADLVDVARLRSGKIELRLEELDVAAELGSICDSAKHRAHAKNQKLVMNGPASPLALRADRHRLQQIVFNLLDNAIKYTPEGGRIWVKLTEEVGYAVVRIQDDGVGIPPQLLPAIFDLFTQEQAGHSQDGFGVGLSVVRDLVAAHGGVAEARSDGKGKGSEFTVRLPLDGPANP